MNRFEIPSDLKALMPEMSDEEWLKGQETLYYYFKDQIESYELEDQETAESDTGKKVEVPNVRDKNGNPLSIPDPEIIHFNKNFDDESLNDIFDQLEELHPLIEAEFRAGELSHKLIVLLQQFHYCRGFIESLGHFKQDEFRSERGLKRANNARIRDALAEEARTIWIAKMIVCKMATGDARKEAEWNLGKRIRDIVNNSALARLVPLALLSLASLVALVEL